VKPGLHLRINQQLALTPQLQQAIRLLQLSSMELEIELREALESNPLLELTELNGQSQLTNGDATAANEPEAAAETPGENAEAPAREELEYAEPDDFSLERFEYSSGGQVPDDGEGFESQDQEPEDLRDHLLWQLNLSPLSARDRAIRLITDEFKSARLASSGLSKNFF